MIDTIIIFLIIAIHGFEKINKLKTYLLCQLYIKTMLFNIFILRTEALFFCECCTKLIT